MANTFKRLGINLLATAGTDIRVKVTASDTTSGFLDEKISVPASGKLSKSVVNAGGNETIAYDIVDSAIDHDALLNFEAAEHRLQDDAQTTNSTLWSSQKTQDELDQKVNRIDPVADNRLLKSVGTTGVDMEQTAITVDDSGNVTGIQNLTVSGNLTVDGTTTSVNSANLEVTDANITVNNGGTQASADLASAGITVEMSDATDAIVGYDSTLTSKFKIGESGDLREVVTTTHAQTLLNKTIDADSNTLSNIELDNLKSSAIDLDDTLSTADDTKVPTSLTVKNYVDSKVVSFEEIFQDTSEPTGILDLSESSISFDDVNRRFSISPTGSTFSYYIAGTKYTVSSTKTLDINNTDGMHHIYIDETGSLVESDNFDPEVLLKSNCYLCAVYWNSSEQLSVYVADERHGITMDWATHAHFHTAFGAQYISGLALSNINSDQNGSLDSHAQISVDNGRIRDEDFLHIIQSGLPQTLAPIANVPLLYRKGANSVWSKIPATNFPVTTTGTGRAAYNEWTGTEFKLTEVSNNNYVLTHLYATNGINNPIFAIIGANEYQTVSAARAGANEEINQVGDLPFEEVVPIASIILQTSNSYTNSVKSIIRTTDSGADYVDWRSIQVNSSTSLGDHSVLAGRSDSDSHPATAISNIPLGNLTSTNVQSALNELQTEVDNVNSFTPSRTLYVDVVNGDDTFSGSFTNPYKTIQAAIDASTETGSLIYVNNGVYSEDLVLSGKNNLTIAAEGVIDSPSTFILGTIDLTDSKRVRFKNFGIQKASTSPIIKFSNVDPNPGIEGSSRHYFESCSISNLTTGEKVVELGEGITEFIIFRGCAFTGVISMPDITSTGSSLSLLECTSEDSAINIGTNQTLLAVDCYSLGNITHTNGVIYLKDIHSVERDESNRFLVSSATFSASNLVYLEDVNLYDPLSLNPYATLVIPSTAFVLNGCSRDGSDVLNESLRITRGQRSFDIRYENADSSLSSSDVKSAIDELDFNKLDAADFSSNFDSNLATKSTDDLAEGSNQYYTDAKAKSAVVVNSMAGTEIDQSPSVNAVKNFINTSSPEGALSKASGDIDLTSFTGVEGAVSAPITGFVFDELVVRSFKAQISVSRIATTDLYEVFEILGLNRGGVWEITYSSLGDASGVTFEIDNNGQIVYNSNSLTGHSSTVMSFRALVTHI